jgi:hypothetical protein
VHLYSHGARHTSPVTGDQRGLRGLGRIRHGSPAALQVCLSTRLFPPDTCGTPVVEDWDDGSVDSTDHPSGGLWDKDSNYDQNKWQCMIFKTNKHPDWGPMQCYNNACKQQVDEAEAEGRTTNYGCVGSWPLDQPIPWTPYPGDSSPDMVYAMGHCSCDNALVNFLADTIVEALPIIAQVSFPSRLLLTRPVLLAYSQSS